MSSDIQQFQLKGFHHSKALVTTEECANLRSEVKRYLRDIAPERTVGEAVSAKDAINPDLSEDQFVFLTRMDQHDDFFNLFRQDPRLAKLASELLGGEVEVQHVQFFDVIPDVSLPTPPHQDAEIFLLNPSNALTFWIPLSEMTEENGCLHYAPGSHWDGYLPHASKRMVLQNENDCRDRGVPMEVMPGDLLVHHCFTIHYSSQNLSGKSRWALAVHFYPKGSERIGKAEWMRCNRGY